MGNLTAASFIQTLKKVLPILKDKAFPDDLTETLSRILEPHDPVIDRERFNIVMSSFHMPPARHSFFEYYFEGLIDSTELLERGIVKFVKDAIWHFGELRTAYTVLGKTDDVKAYIQRHKFDCDDFKSRRPWRMIDDIKPEDRGFLGYVSGQRPFREEKVLDSAEMILNHMEKNRPQYKDLKPADLSFQLAQDLTAELSEKVEHLQPDAEKMGLQLFEFAELSANKHKIADIRKRVRETIVKVNSLKEIGRKNQLSYLRNVEMIDVYVATSMRDDREYNDMYTFVHSVFTDELVKPLNLRYFDPTLCYCNSRIDKGIIECLLVRCAKVTIYCAQEGDTFGKDSELAATLCQGKPVIVYVPQGSAALDKRAAVFKDFHPLGLQVGLTDGVARGVIVVRSPEECARMLYQLLCNEIEVKITFEDNGVVLREVETNSVMRVMTGWRALSSSFWHNFGLSELVKQGLPAES
ncbi:MAG: hypothetical protein NTY98_05460 [Verrucomicrobia bacterium]|nr:hypothetical protein [Verrucomicrobiota bacterium]